MDSGTEETSGKKRMKDDNRTIKNKKGEDESGGRKDE